MKTLLVPIVEAAIEVGLAVSNHLCWLPSYHPIFSITTTVTTVLAPSAD
jgi:hypothetical protein